MTAENNLSAFQKAASLAPDAELILDVAEQDRPVDPDTIVCEIDIKEYEVCLRDSTWQAFQKEALDYRRRMVSEGRSR